MSPKRCPNLIPQTPRLGTTISRTIVLQQLQERRNRLDFLELGRIGTGQVSRQPRQIRDVSKDEIHVLPVSPSPAFRIRKPLFNIVTHARRAAAPLP